MNIPCNELISPPERARAIRFHYPRDSNRYLVARGVLRYLIGNYLNRPPRSLTFGYGPYGKPFLAEDHGSQLFFNLSHAGGYALYAFTTGQPVGVDLEKEDPNIGIEGLTRRFFSPSESSQVLALPDLERVPAFFRTWTRKEAFLKANGAGLSLPLDQFSVTVDINEPVKVARIDWAPEETSKWEAASFMVAEGLPGAVVVGKELRKTSFYHVPVSRL